MTAQPDMSGFGRPPVAPTGFRKFAPYVATAASGGAIVLVGLYLAQIALPERMKPGYVAGTMAGSETLGHLQTSGDEQISYDTRSQASLQTVTATTQAMGGEIAIAQGADVACAASRMGAAVAAKQRPVWGARDSTAEWWYEMLRDVGDATCGVGAQVRGAMVEELSGRARESTTLNVRNTQDMAPPSGRVEISTHRYTDAELSQVKAYAATLPADVQMQLIQNLPQDAWNVYGDRVNAYYAANHAKRY